MIKIKVILSCNIFIIFIGFYIKTDEIILNNMNEDSQSNSPEKEISSEISKELVEEINKIDKYKDKTEVTNSSQSSYFNTKVKTFNVKNFLRTTLFYQRTRPLDIKFKYHSRPIKMIIGRSLFIIYLNTHNKYSFNCSSSFNSQISVNNPLNDSCIASIDEVMSSFFNHSSEPEKKLIDYASLCIEIYSPKIDLDSNKTEYEKQYHEFYPKKNMVITLGRKGCKISVNDPYIADSHGCFTYSIQTKTWTFVLNTFNDVNSKKNKLSKSKMDLKPDASELNISKYFFYWLEINTYHPIEKEKAISLVFQDLFVYISHC